MNRLFILYTLFIFSACKDQSSDSTDRKNKNFYPKEPTQQTNIDLVKNNARKKEFSDSQYKYAEFHQNNSSFDSAYYYFEQAITNYTQQKDSIGVVKSKINIAKILIDHDDISTGKKIALEALELIPNNQQDLNTEIYLTVAKANHQLGHYENELDWLNKVDRNSVDQFTLTKVDLLKAKSLLQQNKIENALELLNKIEKDSIIKKNNQLKAIFLDQITYLNWVIKPNKNTLEDYTNALQVSRINKLNKEQISILNHLIEYYQMEDKNKAIFFSKEMYNLTKKNNDINGQIESIKNLISFNTILSKKEISDYLIAYNELQNLKKERKLSIDRIKVKNDLNQDHLKILALQKQQNESNLFRAKITTFIILIWLIIAVVVFWITSYKNKKKSLEMKLSAIYETEIDISQKLHDELANDVYQAMTIINNTNFENEKLKDRLIKTLNQVYSHTRTFSRDNNIIDLDRFDEELDYMISSYGSNQIQILKTGIENIPWDKIQKHVKITIYRTIIELLTNMKKHSNCSLVVVKFEIRNNNLIVEYADNGSKYENISTSQYNGIKNVETRIRRIEGTIIFGYSKGYKASINIPKPIL